MAITFDWRLEDEILHIIARGKDESLEEVTAYGEAIVALALEQGCYKLLCDERNLVYRISLSDTYELGVNHSQHNKVSAYVALVCSEANLEIAKFFENVMRNRGIYLQAFTDIELAKAWLKQK
jgi:hypothetical protein